MLTHQLSDVSVFPVAVAAPDLRYLFNCSFAQTLETASVINTEGVVAITVRENPKLRVRMDREIELDASLTRTRPPETQYVVAQRFGL